MESAPYIGMDSKVSKWSKNPFTKPRVSSTLGVKLIWDVSFNIFFPWKEMGLCVDNPLNWRATQRQFPSNCEDTCWLQYILSSLAILMGPLQVKRSCSQRLMLCLTLNNSVEDATLDASSSPAEGSSRVLLPVMLNVNKVETTSNNWTGVVCWV